MLLFISTEVMLFSALLASYIVLRFSGGQGWPRAEQVGVSVTLGVINTVILMLSGITMWLSVRQCARNQTSNSRIWLLATLLLGLSFLGIKAFEYKSKYDHGIFPSSKQSLIYDAADDRYLSRTVSEMRAEIQRVEQLASQGQLEQKQKRLEELYLLQSGIVDWTQYVVGRSSDPNVKREAIAALAHQIYHHDSDPAVSKYIAAEQKSVDAERLRLSEKLDRILKERSVAQEELRELLPKKDSGDQEILRQFDQVSETVSRLDEDVADLNKEIRPIENRLLAIESVNSGAGINESYDVRLPMVIPGGHKWSSLYYLLTGAHAIHLVAGLVPMLFLLFVRLGGQWLGWMENLSLYWHFVDVVWLVVFAIIYLT